MLPITRLFPHAPDLNAGPIAVAADGTKALVVNATFPDTPARGSVAVLDTRTLRVTRRVATGTEPVGLAVDPARNQAYVAELPGRHRQPGSGSATRARACSSGRPSTCVAPY